MAVAVILGDPHLGQGISIGKNGIGSTLNSRIVDQISLLEWTLKQAIDRQAGYIIITGDVFEDPRPSSILITTFINWLRKCSDNDVQVHICKGNHDIVRSGQHHSSSFDIISAANLDNVFIYNDISSFEAPGVSFTILPFRDRRSFNTNHNSEAVKLVQDKIKFECCGLDNRNLKVLVGHFALVGSLPIGDEIDDMANELFIPLETFKNYDYTFLGHIHKPQVMNKKPHICHIGSMGISNFAENSHSKVIAVIDSEKREDKILEYVELPNRPLIQISVSIPSDAEDTTQFVLNFLKSKNYNLNRSIVKMHIIYESSDLSNIDKIKVEEEIMKLGAFHIPRIDQERKLTQIKKNANMESIDNTVNESVAIKMYADENVQDDLKNEFISLANAIVTETKENNATS